MLSLPVHCLIVQRAPATLQVRQPMANTEEGSFKLRLWLTSPPTQLKPHKKTPSFALPHVATVVTETDAPAKLASFSTAQEETPQRVSPNREKRYDVSQSRVSARPGGSEPATPRSDDCAVVMLRHGRYPPYLLWAAPAVQGP